MKRKSLVLFIMVVLFTVFNVFTGCSNKSKAENETAKKQYRFKIYGETDSSLVNLNNVEIYKKDDKTFKDTDLLGTEKTIEWLGNVYTGKYYNTRDSEFSTNPMVEYLSETLPDGRNVLFILDSKTNNILSFFTVIKQYNGLFDGMPVKSEDECKLIADEYLKKIAIDDYDQYSLNNVEKFSLGDYDDYYYDYCRMVGGIKSVEKIIVVINNFGIYEGHNTFYSGQLKNTEAPSWYNEAETDKAVEAKINELSNDDKISYEIKDKQLIKTEDDKIGVLYTTEISKELIIDNKDRSITEQIRFLVTLE